MYSRTVHEHFCYSQYDSASERSSPKTAYLQGAPASSALRQDSATIVVAVFDNVRSRLKERQQLITVRKDLSQNNRTATGLLV